MATFGELKTRIGAMLTDASLQYPTTSQIGDVINLVCRRYNNKKFWFVDATAEITLNVNDPVVPDIPSDFKSLDQPHGMVVTYNGFKYPLAYRPPDLYDMVDLEGIGLPYCYTYRANEFRLYFYPDQPYVLLLHYRKFADALVNDDDVNVFTENVPDLVVYQSLATIYRTYKKDMERANELQDEANREFANVMDETYDRNASGRLTPDNLYENYYFYGR